MESGGWWALVVLNPHLFLFDMHIAVLLWGLDCNIASNSSFPCYKAYTTPFASWASMPPMAALVLSSSRGRAGPWDAGGHELGRGSDCARVVQAPVPVPRDEKAACPAPHGIRSTRTAWNRACRPQEGPDLFSDS